MIEIKKLNFSYEKEIFSDLNLIFKKNKWTSIIGNIGTGKTTLLKILSGLINTRNLYFNHELINKNNIKTYREKIGVVFENPDYMLIGPTIIDDFYLTLSTLDLSKKEKDKRIEEISKLFSLEELLNKEVIKLSFGQKQICTIALAVINNPEIIILDDCTSMLDEQEKQKVLQVLNSLKKNHTIITLSNDLADTIQSDYIYIIDKKVIIEGETKKVLERDDLVDLGFKLPFMVSLSQKLKYYGILNKTIYNIEEMVDEIWK